MYGRKLDDAFYFVVPLNTDSDFDFDVGADDNDLSIPVSKDENNIVVPAKDNVIVVLPTRARTI